MKVVDKQDRFGNDVIVFPKSATLPDIWEWLDRNRHDYVYTIVMDCTKDEYEECKQIIVNYLPDIADEAVQANGNMVAVKRSEYMKMRDDAMKWRRQHD